MRATVKPAPASRASIMPSAPPSAGVTERQRTRSRAIETGLAGWRMGKSGVAGERIRPQAVRANGPGAETELDDQDQRQQSKGNENDAVECIGGIDGAVPQREQVERDVDGKEQGDHPGRQIAVIGALLREREFRIGERQI